MADILIETRGLAKSYFLDGGEIPVLRGIDARILRGEIVAVTGRSGAGKTTLLNLLGALDRPSAGEILFRGKSYNELSETEFARFRNRNVGFVFQFHNLLGEFTALENVMMPLLLRRLPWNEARLRSEEILNELELQSRLHHRPSEMSGGEQQRVAVARALVNLPELVLADEPSGNLDLASGEILINLLWKLSREKRHTFIIVTHNRELAHKADRIIELQDGKIT